MLSTSIEDSCGNKCNNHGKCFEANPLHKFCICDLWFTGQQCELEVPGNTIFMFKICVTILFAIIIMVSFGPIFIKSCRLKFFKHSEFRLLGVSQFSQFLMNRKMIRRQDYQEHLSVQEVTSLSKESSTTEVKTSSTTNTQCRF